MAEECAVAQRRRGAKETVARRVTECVSGSRPRGCVWYRSCGCYESVRATGLFGAAAGTKARASDGAVRGCGCYDVPPGDHNVSDACPLACEERLRPRPAVVLAHHKDRVLRHAVVLAQRFVGGGQACGHGRTRSGSEGVRGEALVVTY